MPGARGRARVRASRKIARSIWRALRDTHVEGRKDDVDFIPEFVDTVKTSEGAGVAASHVVTVVGKLFTRGETRGFANDFVAFDHKVIAIAVLDYPFTTE